MKGHLLRVPGPVQRVIRGRVPGDWGCRWGEPAAPEADGREAGGGTAEPWGEVLAGKGVGPAGAAGGTGTFRVPTWCPKPCIRRHLILLRAL